MDKRSARRWAGVLLGVVSAAPAMGAAPCPEEQIRAQAARARVEQEWPLRGNDALTGLVREFVTRLAWSAGVEAKSNWRVRVVRDYSVNAFSIGDGYIYVTEGALQAAANEAELAAILAHEMGHDLAGHFCPRSPGEAIGGAGWSAANPSGQVGLSHFGSLRQVLDPAKEREAEQIADRILQKAGYPATDPRALVLRGTAGARVPDGASAQDGGPLERIQALLAQGR